MKLLVAACFSCVLFYSVPSFGQDAAPDWQTQVRRLCEARDWASAMRLVEQEIARAPRDMDVEEWRARVLTWSGRLAEAEAAYLAILKVSRNDPDKWMGLASVYLREGKTQEALRATATAVELDPKRSDLHAARGRALRASGEQGEARKEFQAALRLDASSTEARSGLLSLRGEPKQELRFGDDTDLFNFADANRGEWVSLTSHWTGRWFTNASGNFYQRGGTGAGKFVGSVTRSQPKWGTVTIGGAVGHDNAVIPKSEAFFDLDHGFKVGEASLVRALELSYGQHWYWYQSSRILTLNGTAIAYLPREWTLTVGATGARSAFAVTILLAAALGVLSRGFFIQFLLFGYAFATVISIGSVLQEEVTYKRYNDWKDVVRLVSYCFFEHFPYRQLNMIWRLQGLWQYMRGDNTWGALNRKGMESAAVQSSD